MEIEFYHVDAFCIDRFTGNPAGVCQLNNWPEDSLLQNIAMENNLAETAFFVARENHFEIRWFTPTTEVDLCGHATLATAHVLFHHKNYGGDCIQFISPRSGALSVKKGNEMLTLDFPVDQYGSIPVNENMTDWFGVKPIEAYKGKTDYMLVFSTESDISKIRANLAILQTLKEVRGVIVTAKGKTVDFVSRFFAPQSGIPEDPVTGSAHTTLTPYWSKQLGKKELIAMQLSPRKGFLKCKDLGERIEISGRTKSFITGKIIL